MQFNKPQVKRTRSYVEEAFRQIEQNRDILDIVIINRNGCPVKTTMKEEAATEFSGLYGTLLDKVQVGLQKIDSEDELLMLRIRTKSNEVLVVPDDKITVMVVQNARGGNVM